MTYTIKCQHCKEDVEYYGIWEAEIHYGHECKELLKYEKKIHEDTVITKWRNYNGD